MNANQQLQATRTRTQKRAAKKKAAVAAKTKYYADRLEIRREQVKRRDTLIEGLTKELEAAKQALAEAETSAAKLKAKYEPAPELHASSAEAQPTAPADQTATP